MEDGEDEGLNVKKLIGILAEKHGLMLSPNDPIFALLTVNEVVLARYLGLLNEALATMRETLATASADQTAAAKDLAERTITKGADYVAKQLELAGSKAAAHIAEAANAAEKAWYKEAAAQRRRHVGLMVLLALILVSWLMLSLRC